MKCGEVKEFCQHHVGSESKTEIPFQVYVSSKPLFLRSLNTPTPENLSRILRVLQRSDYWAGRASYLPFLQFLEELKTKVAIIRWTNAMPIWQGKNLNFNNSFTSHVISLRISSKALQDWSAHFRPHLRPVLRCIVGWELLMSSSLAFCSFIHLFIHSLHRIPGYPSRYSSV